MHISLIYPGYPPETHAGGIGTYIYEFVRAIRKYDVKVSIISRSDKVRNVTERLFPNVVLYRLGEDLSALTDPKLLFRKEGYVRYQEVLKATLDQINSQKKIDVIETCDWGAECVSLLSTQYAPRLIVRCHTPSFISESYNPQNALYLSDQIKEGEREIIRSAKHVISPSHHLADTICNKLNLERVIQIEPYLLNAQDIPPKGNYSLEDEEFKLLTVGRIEQRKGQDLAIKAVEILRKKGFQVSLHVVGADTLSTRGVRMSEEFMSNIESQMRNEIFFKGEIPRKKVLGLYSQYDIYVAASRFDNFPFTVLEAMSAGLPVVGNRSAEGIAEQVEYDHNGLLFDGSAFDLAKQIEKLIRDSKYRCKLGVNAKKHVRKKHDPDTVMPSILNNYLSICTTLTT